MQVAKIHKSQYLYKKKSNLKCLLQGWLKRWFVLRSNCELVYYKNKKEYEILHIINLAFVHSIHQLHYSKKHPNCIVIATNSDDESRLYIFDTETSEDCHNWISAIVQVISSYHRQKLVKNFYILDLTECPNLLKNSLTSFVSGSSVDDSFVSHGHFFMEDLEKSWWTQLLNSLDVKDQSIWLQDVDYSPKIILPPSNIEEVFPDLSVCHEPLVSTDIDSEDDEIIDSDNEGYPEVPSISPKLAIISNNIPSPFQLPLDKNIPILSSYLLKKNDHSNKNDQWYKRWYVLRGSTLTRYRDQNEYEPIEMISCKDIIDIIPYFYQGEKKLTKMKKKKEFSDEMHVSLSQTKQLLDDFYEEAGNYLKSGKSWDDVKVLKDEMWNSFAAIANVLYVMDILMVKRTLVLATESPELFEKWIVELRKACVLSRK